MLNMHEEFLFEHLLNHDFLEGKVLNYVAKRDNLSRKKLYLAFHKRWSLPEQGDDKTRICRHGHALMTMQMMKTTIM